MAIYQQTEKKEKTTTVYLPKETPLIVNYLFGDYDGINKNIGYGAFNINK